MKKQLYTYYTKKSEYFLTIHRNDIQLIRVSIIGESIGYIQVLGEPVEKTHLSRAWSAQATFRRVKSRIYNRYSGSCYFYQEVEF